MNSIRCKLIAICTAAFVVELPVQPLQAEVVNNGSFESASIDPGGKFITLLPGSTAIDGWTVGPGDSIDYQGNGTLWNASDGFRSLDLNGVGPGSIAQTISTAAGQSYDVFFDMAANTGFSPPDPPVTMKIEVSAAGSSGMFSFSTAGHSYSDMGWETMHFAFTAIGADTTLSFASLNSDTGSAGPTLDNVRIVAVPEPTISVTSALGAIFVFGFILQRLR